jgi:hypothetical protein
MIDAWRFPNLGYCSSAPSLPGLEKSGIQCRYISAASDFQKDYLSEEVLTHVLLDRRELAAFQDVPVDDRPLWLFGRTAAKDSVRAWVKNNYNRDLFPADIHLVPQAGGHFQSEGFWSGEFAPPQVSICAAQGAIFAAAGAERSALAAIAEGETDVASYFPPDEQARLDRMENPAEWKARALAAKLAAGLFLRPNADPGYVGSLILGKINVAGETIEIADPDMAINAEDAVTVATGRYQGLIVAVAFL